MSLSISQQRFSGITEELLSPVCKTLDDAYKEISEWIGEETYLIGHGLENDLFALKIIHKNVLDSALLFPKGCGAKFKLKELAHKYLGRHIQDPKKGHNPVEDALAALNLIQLKLQNGLTYGCPPREKCSIFTLLGKYNIKSLLIGPSTVGTQIKNSSVSITGSQNNKDTFERCSHELKKIVNEEEKMKFIWLYLQNEGFHEPDKQNTAFDTLIHGLLNVYEAASYNTVFMLVGGNKDVGKLSYLQQKHVEFLQKKN